MGKIIKGGAIFIGAAVVGALIAIVMSDPELKNSIKVKGMKTVESISTVMEGVASLQERMAQLKKEPTLEDEWAEVDKALAENNG